MSITKQAESCVVVTFMTYSPQTSRRVSGNLHQKENVMDESIHTKNDEAVVEQLLGTSRNFSNDIRPEV